MTRSRNVRSRALPVSWTSRLRLRPAARHDDACEQERARYLTDVAPLVVRLGTLEAQLVPLHATLMARATEHARAGTAPSAEQLARRSAGEHDLPDEVVRQRRQAERDRRVAAAAAAQDEAQQALDAVLAERAELEASCRQRAEIARSRLLALGDHTVGLPDAEVLVHEWRNLCSGPAPVAA